MTIKLPEAVERSIRAAVEEGRFASAEQAVEAAWRVYEPPARSTAGPDDAPSPKPDRLIRGETTLYGQCLGVGGLAPGASILDIDGTLRRITIDKELATQLALRLYTEVGLDGEAAWDLDTWEMVEFKAIRINPCQPTDLTVAFRELADAAGDAWDGVDVPAYIANLRGEDPS